MLRPATRFNPYVRRKSGSINFIIELYFLISSLSFTSHVPLHLFVEAVPVLEKLTFCTRLLPRSSLLNVLILRESLTGRGTSTMDFLSNPISAVFKKLICERTIRVAIISAWEIPNWSTTSTFLSENPVFLCEKLMLLFMA